MRVLTEKFSKVLAFSVLFCVLWQNSCLDVLAAGRVQPTEDPIVIVIDPGHGGENEGTIENGFLEKSMDLITAQAMYDELSKYDNVTVHMTRTEDVGVIIADRAQFAQDVGADMLFSIHYNASVDHDLFGTEVWIPSSAPYNAYGYQFGYLQMLAMQEKGLFLRGIKTKLNDKGTDYYGILRECTARSIPSVLIEHCHVDEGRDYPFCDTEEELIAFGKEDATTVAKYFGLSSTELGVDYSNENSLPEVQGEVLVQSTMVDETAPDVCMIEVKDVDFETGIVHIEVNAADYDSTLIYYDYSMDGGMTFTPLQEWPESDALQGTYADTFTLTVQVPSGVSPRFVVRAYNMFDLFTESVYMSILQTFDYGEEVPEETIDATEETSNLPGTETFMPANSSKMTEDEDVSFLGFLKLCLIIVIILFVVVLITMSITYHKRKKRRRVQNKRK